MNLTQPSMHRHSGRRTAIVLAVLGVALTAAIATNVAIGSTDYPPIQIIHILAAGPSPDAASQIIWEIRNGNSDTVITLEQLPVFSING